MTICLSVEPFSISCLEPFRLQLERELEAHVAEEQKEQEQAKLEEEEEERKQKESGPAAVFQTLLAFTVVAKGLKGCHCLCFA